MKTYASGCARCKTKDGFSLRFCIDFPIETAWWFLSQQSSTSKSSSSSSFWSQTMLKHARIIYGIVSFDPAHSDSLKMNTCSWSSRNVSTVEIVASKTSVQVCLHLDPKHRNLSLVHGCEPRCDGLLACRVSDPF